MQTGALVGFTVDTFEGIQASYLLQVLRKAGVEFSEVTPSIFDDIEKVVSNLNGLKLGLHLPLIADYGYDFSCHEKKQEIDALIEKVNRHWKRMNLQYALAHPTEGHFEDTPGETSEEFLFENLRRLEVPIVVENTLENEDFDFDQFLERAELALGDRLIGICFDPPHAYMSRDDFFPMLKKHYSKIRLLHLSDCTREEDLHQPFGQEGNLPVKAILEFLRDKRYREMINLEIRPRSLSDLGPLFNSYLLVLRSVNRMKYFSMRLRSFFFLPMLQRRFRGNPG